MEYMEWCHTVETVRPHVVRIVTPEVSGTGFLLSHVESSSICAVATAAHVVSHAHYWEQPIRIVDNTSGKPLLLRSINRAIFMDEAKDTGAIVFDKGELSLPEKPLDFLPPEGLSLKVGNELGWLGFPALARGNLCFFSGRVSAWGREQLDYLVDGVAINGVSGGPAFWNGLNKITLTGVVSAYIANRATGETLPGLAVVTNVHQFHELTKMFKSVNEAKEQESPPQPPAAEPAEAD